MKTIPLSRGMVTIVDDADYEFVNQWKWFAHKSRNFFYAARNVTVNGRRTTLKMHTVLAGAALGQRVDHADRCTLNNQRSNLRICTPSQNTCNSSRVTTNRSGFKGVSWHNKHKKWRARLRHNGKEISLGYFDDKLEAAKAYDAAARNTYGEFSLTNERLNLFTSTT